MGRYPPLWLKPMEPSCIGVFQIPPIIFIMGFFNNIGFEFMDYIKFLICSIIFWSVLFVFCWLYELIDRNKKIRDGGNDER